MRSPGDYSQLDDVALLKRSKRDADAFHEIYSRYVVTIDGWLRQRSADGHVAAELTAETFAQAWYSRKRFKDTGEASVIRWLFGIARNVMLTYNHKEKVHTSATSRLRMELRSLDQSQMDQTTELDAELALQLELLPAEQRAALELRVIEDLSYAQIAERLGCSENAARLRVSRSLGAMRERLTIEAVPTTS